MNPKEKAKELVKKFSHKLPYYSEKDNTEKSKQCALICVEEIIYNIQHGVNKYEWTLERRGGSDFILYWQEVKQEIKRYESTNN